MALLNFANRILVCYQSILAVQIVTCTRKSSIILCPLYLCSICLHSCHHACTCFEVRGVSLGVMHMKASSFLLSEIREIFHDSTAENIEHYYKNSEKAYKDSQPKNASTPDQLCRFKYCLCSESSITFKQYFDGSRPLLLLLLLLRIYHQFQATLRAN